MKKNYILIFCFLLISFSNCGVVRYWTGSNATWEETVTFIDNYKGHFSEIIVSPDYVSSSYNIEEVALKNDIMIIKVGQNNDTELVRSFKIPLKSFKETDKNFLGYISVSSHGHYFKEYRDLRLIRSHDEVSLKCLDKEMTPRLYKALNHLAKLANKQRKQEREAKNEKF